MLATTASVCQQEGCNVLVVGVSGGDAFSGGDVRCSIVAMHEGSWVLLSFVLLSLYVAVHVLIPLAMCFCMCIHGLLPWLHATLHVRCHSACAYMPSCLQHMPCMFTKACLQQAATYSTHLAQCFCPV